MRQQGTVVRWETARGFGFIRGKSAQDVFFHVKDFQSFEGAVPRPGLKVDFDEVHVGGKGPRAMAVRPVGWRPSEPAKPPAQPSPPRRTDSAPRSESAGSGAAIALPLMLAYAGVLVYAVWTRIAPWWIVAASLGLNLAAFFAYWQDKDAATKRRWRISEDTLHAWSLAGGWGGAWFAQQLLRHKSRKASFRQVYWLTVVLHCAGVGYWTFGLR